MKNAARHALVLAVEEGRKGLSAPPAVVSHGSAPVARTAGHR